MHHAVLYTDTGAREQKLSWGQGRGQTRHRRRQDRDAEGVKGEEMEQCEQIICRRCGVCTILAPSTKVLTWPYSRLCIRPRIIQ